MENILIQDLSILSDQLLLIDRQVVTGSGKKIDLLAIDAEGNLTIIELKKHRTPRDVVAQAIDYATWVKELSYAEIKSISEKPYGSEEFEILFEKKFGIHPPEEINRRHDMLIVCSCRFR